jgi:uncharacterized membrane protein
MHILTTGLARLRRLFKHRWMDARDAHRAVPADMVERLMRRVAASEARHSGEVRICVEAALPTSYLWHGLRARDRAITLFGKLRVWDTEHNNGVLIYLLLAERAIEIVADRGLNAHVSQEAWRAPVQRMGTAFRDGKYEDGLTEALGEVSALLVQYFPLDAGAAHHNELPDQPLVQ